MDIKSELAWLVMEAVAKNSWADTDPAAEAIKVFQWSSAAITNPTTCSTTSFLDADWLESKLTSCSNLVNDAHLTIMEWQPVWWAIKSGTQRSTFELASSDDKTTAFQFNSQAPSVGKTHDDYVAEWHAKDDFPDWIQ